MLPWETLRARDDRRARRRTDLAALEILEGRQLLSYTSLGYSLPDLQVSGTAGTVAVWGGTFRVSVMLKNTGASTIIEPLSMVPTTQLAIGPDGMPVPPYAIPSQADVPSSQVGIYVGRSAHSLSRAVLVGTVQAPALSQNNVEQFDTTITLPSRPAGLPARGIYYVHLVANLDQSVAETNLRNNVSPPVPVRFISKALPMLRATALAVPPVMQPGDTIAPTIRIANVGSAGTLAQGPVEFALVASVTPDFNLGSSIIAQYTWNDDIPGQSDTPIQTRARRHRKLFGSLAAARDNVVPPGNVITYTGAPVTLPTSPETYYIGVVIDPNNKLKQLSTPSNRLELINVVGPPIPNLPPAGVLSAALTQQFPNPPDGKPIGNVNSASL